MSDLEEGNLKERAQASARPLESSSGSTGVEGTVDSAETKEAVLEEAEQYSTK